MCKESVNPVDSTEVKEVKEVKAEISEIGKEWIAALRSGAYNQAKSRLRSKDGYCCLGVLVDLLTQKGLAKWEFFNGDWRVSMVKEPIVTCTAILPISMARLIGVAPSGSVSLGEENKDLYSLTALNDERGFTFPQIADVLEGNPVAYGIDKK